MELDNAIKERHTVRSFKTTKKPTYQQVIEAIDAANHSPLAGNAPCLRYILIQDKEKIKQLSEAAVQEFFQTVDFVVVVCSDKGFLKRSYYERGDSYSKQQAGAAIENFLLKITDLGLASCWIGAFSDELVKRTLEIPADIEVEAILPVGYEMGKEKQKTKPNLDNVLYFNKWGNKFMKPKTKVPGHKI
jgi:nitroreductase